MSINFIEEGVASVPVKLTKEVSVMCLSGLRKEVWPLCQLVLKKKVWLLCLSGLREEV